MTSKIFFISSFLFLFILPNIGFGQNCQSIEIEKDPFTKKTTASSKLISPHSDLSFGYYSEGGHSYLRVRYRNNIGYAIGYNKPADLPTFDQRTFFWVLFSDDSVIKLNYTGSRIVATDPRDRDGPPDARTYLVRDIEDEPMTDSGRIKSYHVSATGNFLLSKSELNKLRYKSISKIRIERNDKKIDANVSQSNYIKNMIECTD